LTKSNRNLVPYQEIVAVTERDAFRISSSAFNQFDRNNSQQNFQVLKPNQKSILLDRIINTGGVFKGHTVKRKIYNRSTCLGISNIVKLKDEPYQQYSRKLDTSLD
jgi:hypothetical protein